MHWSKGALPGIIRDSSVTSSGIEAEGIGTRERMGTALQLLMHSQIPIATADDIYCANMHYLSADIVPER